MVDEQVVAHTYHKYYHRPCPWTPLWPPWWHLPQFCTPLSSQPPNSHSLVSSLEIFNGTIKKVACFINWRSDFSSLPARVVVVQLLVQPPPEQRQSPSTKFYVHCILCTVTYVSTATISDPSLYSPTMSLTSLVSSLEISSFTLCSPSTIWWP